MRLEREGDGVRIAELACGRRDMALLKLTGSAFTAFVRDDYTTLPDRRDRPLFVGIDVGWRYADPTDALGTDPGRYVAAAQASDLLCAVFTEFVSESIQHLVHEMGVRMLDRYPTLAEVSFEGRNLTRDPVVEGVYTDPFPAHGTITLTMPGADGGAADHARPRHGPRPSGRRRGDHPPPRGRGRRPRPSPTPTAAPTPRSSRVPTSWPASTS